MKVLQLKVRRFGMFIETSGECAVYLNKEASCVTDTSYNLGQTLRQCCNIHIFMSFLGSLLKQCILLEIFLQFSLPPPYTKRKLDTRVLHCLWGEVEGWDLGELENAQEMRKRLFVHDCSYLEKKEQKCLKSLQSSCCILHPTCVLLF